VNEIILAIYSFYLETLCLQAHFVCLNKIEAYLFIIITNEVVSDSLGRFAHTAGLFPGPWRRGALDFTANLRGSRFHGKV